MEEIANPIWEIKTYQDSTGGRVVERFINPFDESDYFFKGIATGFDSTGNYAPFDFIFDDDGLTLKECFDRFEEYGEKGAQALKDKYESQSEAVRKSDQEIVLPNEG